MQPIPSKFRDWASMARLPNVPTVWSNVFTAWMLAGGGLSSFAQRASFLSLIIGGTLLYLGGTVLNDIKDVGFDQQFRPERPLPAGRIRVLKAVRAAFGFILAGSTFLFFSTNGIGLALPLCIFAYTHMHKRHPVFGGILMGLCRFLLAVIVGWQVAGGSHLPSIQLDWALALFGYVCCISWAAMNEAETWRRNIVIGLLRALPLLDAGFLLYAKQGSSVIVPIICAGLAWLLRRVASPT